MSYIRIFFAVLKDSLPFSISPRFECADLKADKFGKLATDIHRQNACAGLCGSVAKIITIPAVVTFYEAITADGLVKSQETVLYVIPANSWIKSRTGAGIH